MTTLKKMITIEDKKQVCLEYKQKTATVTLGGDYKLQEKIWRLYILCFEDCDGEPDFYSITRGKTRLSFKASFKQYQKALANISDEDYKIDDVESFDRMM